MECSYTRTPTGFGTIQLQDWRRGAQRPVQTRDFVRGGKETHCFASGQYNSAMTPRRTIITTETLRSGAAASNKPPVRPEGQEAKNTTTPIQLIELGHTICVFHANYFYAVTHFGDTNVIGVLPVSGGAAVVLHGLILLIVQGFFTYRITLFTGKPHIIPALSGILMLCQALAFYTLSAQLITVATKSLKNFVDKWE
ncbi:hypothetical protein C8R41DRAFT_871947 [Lentinula lateritia]|uniref:Uncharacterized protein n=1 Tax=Lentinula lateritia TaxID=40482 RepID=A0ABQ8V3Z5_9AGAR|nr:hypothetical protein C8R41DRAFT_871947 [Lentinula lateritia]